MESFFVFLYPAVAIISIAAYVPQTKTLLFATRRPQNLSLSSWIMWCISSLLAYGYSIFHVHDTMLAITTGLNMTLVFFTTSLIAYNRFIRFGPLPEDMETSIAHESIPVKIESTYE